MLFRSAHAPDSAARAARRGLRVIALDPPAMVRESYGSFTAAWREAHGETELPLMGLGRFIIVAPTDAEAVAIGRRAYPVWHDSFTHLRRMHNRINPHPRPPTYDELERVGQGIAGSPATVTQFLRDQMVQTGSNYLVGQFAFGDLSLAESMTSLELFVSEVMPALRAA